ncbi:single-stranded-DNA-specific exonuclease RecJ [Butyrivibrio sp. AE3004]|uniref:single-stranded-DNA-specific exonuclease RecJ n=1 Tax=Butyrivibrio sp. AE3004 TaxID=1506994 RepID=UPI0004949CDA|nr:single-stranded-DNA-specific exonuclease RecJ [Butyrivibrio sp. AE3004]
MAKWLETRKSADFIKIAKKHGISPITARILRNREVYRDDENDDIDMYLSSDEKYLHDPHLLKDIDKAAEIMKERIKAGDSIRIIGDYDVDGICSSYILLSGLKLCGACVDVVLPHRIQDGYGLSVSLVDKAHEDGKQTIITCDNGIAALDQIAHAKELGMTVIVTDHHEVSYSEDDKSRMILPPADAVVDPKRRDESYPFSEICGAMVAYKFIQVLTEKMGIKNDLTLERFFDEMTIFAGWATVCDVMPLKDENRIIVKRSFNAITRTENEGLRALLRANEIDPYSVTCYIYGFVIGPCLNATGRLDSAMRGLELLMENNPSAAAEIALELKELNDSRKDMTQEGKDEAMELIAKYEGNLPDVLVIYMPELHESIAGIIAGKVREEVNHPVMVVTDTKDQMVKGSGRSIEAYHMFEALSECRDLLTKFGGHKMAAGFSLKKENLEAFREKLNANSKLEEKDFVEILHLDMVLPIRYINMELLKEIERLAPFGQGNPEPLFAARNVELVKGRIMGKNQNVAKLTVRDEEGQPYEMMVFGSIFDKWNEFLDVNFGADNREKLYNGGCNEKMTVNIAYQPKINEFRGEESIQIILKDFC